MIKLLHETEFPNLEVDLEMVWLMLGYSDPSQARPLIKEAFQEAMEMGPALIEPAACYDVFPIARVTPSSVEVEGGVSFESQDLALRHQGAKELAIAISTIGPGLENEVEKLLQSGKSGVGFILDIFGSTAVGMAHFKVKDIIRDYAASKGYQATTHGYCMSKNCPSYQDCFGTIIYSWCPGYGDWSALENKKIFAIVDGTQIGVQVKESGMMTPRKSYAWVMPIGSQKETSRDKCEEWEKDWIKLGTLKTVK